jgi:EAL domain-containing protein (putative c-di-GMP-specific phosphodiesterase class I)
VVFEDATKRREEQRRIEEQLEAMTWVDRIRDALERDRFVLYAQPIIDVASGEVVQHELLIRMLDDAGDIVPPGLFLPVAERHGLIGEIDRWVVREAALLAGAGHAVELNLSGDSLGDPQLVHFVEAQLREAGASPSDVVLEITETALIRNQETARVFAERVAALGCKLALDDFGTGYGGFTYLKQLPFDYLKIDIEFVRDLLENPASRAVVQAVVRLAADFGKKTVAEGVEDDATLAELRALGVDYAQGYGIGRPAPVEDQLI